MVHSHTVHLALGALLSPCTMCDTGEYDDFIASDLELTAQYR